MVSQNDKKVTLSERFFSIDLVRLLSMIAIAHFHIHEATFFENKHSISNHAYFELPLEHYSRFMAFSGFTIIFISYFLIGLFGMSTAKLKQLLLVALVGTLTLFIIYFEDSAPLFEWDIYYFVAAASLFIALVKRWKWLLNSLAFASVLLIAIPPGFWDFPTWHQKWFYAPLFGNYFETGGGSWPLLPWLGLPVLAFALGRTLKDNPGLRRSLRIMRNWEWVVWLLTIASLSPFWGAFYAVPIGADFYQFVQNVARLPWLAHMVVVAFAVRLGFVHSLNHWAQSHSWVSWISKLYLNQKFFFFYIVNWILIGFLANFKTFYMEHWPIFDLVVFGLFPLTELVCHSLVKASKEITGLFKAKWHTAP